MTVEEWLGADNQLGVDIFNKKYRNGTESFDEWLDRVSGGKEPVKDLIRNRKFLFGGRILANRGASSGRKTTYSNCYVTGTDDSIEDIFDAAKKIARTFSYGGGIGLDLSKLSPRGAEIHNAAKTTSGAVSFMDLYSLVTGLIGQSGRRGALMLSLSCEHPDIEEFIDVKTDLDKVTYANISVRVTDAFMEAVTGRGVVPEDTSFRLHFERAETGEIIEKDIDARRLFTRLAENNWNSAEPGILFWDRIEKWNLLSNTPEFKFGGVNPCAEEPLPTGGSCLLGSINLSEFVDEPFTEFASFNFQSFRDAVTIVVSAMNDVLDEGIKLHPLLEQRVAAENWRQIGIGVMGLADMLIKMQIPYGSEESLNISNLIGCVLANEAIYSSALLADKYGKYPSLSDTSRITSTPYIKRVATEETIDKVNKCGLRNSQLLTIAPTGSISTMLNISGGMEPIFANSYLRTTKSLHGNEDVTYKVFPAVVKQYMDTHGITDEGDLPEYFVTARSLNYAQRIDMQAVWQTYIDASISSTVNLPEEATVADVADIYLRAWRKGLKGVTVFRENCKRVAILNAPQDDKPDMSKQSISRGIIMSVPRRQQSEQFRVKTACGSMYISISTDDDGNIINCFTSVGDGGCRCNTESTSRMISLAIRGGVPVEEVIRQLKKAKSCASWQRAIGSGAKLSPGSSCPSAIAAVLQEVLDENKPVQEDQEEEELSTGREQDASDESSCVERGICPDCHDELTRKEGCIICMSCGWSKCT